MRRRSRRMLVVPKDVAGYGRSLAAGMAALGWSVDLVDLMANPLRFEGAPATGMIRALNAVAARSRKQSGVLRYAFWALGYPLRAWIALSVPLRYEAVVVLAGRSLIAGNLDARWARLFGVRVVVVFLGSDARPPYLSGHFMGPSDLDLDAVHSAAKATSRLVVRAETTSDVVICHPASGHFLRRAFVDWLAIGMPAAQPLPGGSRKARQGNEFLVLHAPTRPGPKGSLQVAAAVADLREEGLPVRLLTLQGVANRDVIEQIDRVDLVVDQLFSDTPFPGLVTEAASRGCPVLTFGYARQFLHPWLERHGVPSDHFPPPTMLRAAIRRAATDSDWTAHMALSCERYVLAQCDREAFAARFLHVIRGVAPVDWLIDPEAISYVEGWGIAREALAASLRRYLEEYGEAGLFLAAAHPVIPEVRRLVADHPQGAAGSVDSLA